MQQIDSRQIEKFLREEWEKVVAGVAILILLVFSGLTLAGWSASGDSDDGLPPPPREPLVNLKTAFEFLGAIPEAGPLNGLALTAQIAVYTPPTCSTCRHPPHQPGACQTAGCTCGKTVVVDQPPPPPPPPEKPKIIKFESGVTPLDPRLAFFSISTKPPEGGRIVQWQIDFGDGETDVSHDSWGGNEIRHTYKRDGQFNAILSCRSDRGATAQRPIVVQIGGGGGNEQPVVPNRVDYKVMVMNYSNLNGYVTVFTKITNPTTNEVMGKTFGLHETVFGITLDKAEAAQCVFKGSDGKPVIIKKNQTATVPGTTE